MFGQKRKAQVLAAALLLATVFADSAQAGPLNWLANKLGGDAVGSGHTPIHLIVMQGREIP
jgi:hypothetical protein